MEMTAKFGAGKTVAELIEETQARIRKEPAKAQHRISLFQIMCVQGNWERALTQLNVLKDADEASSSMVKTYTEVIRCENFRAQVFAGTKTPLFVGEPADWIGKAMQALRLNASGDAAQAAAMRAEAFEAAPATEGTLNDVPFDWIADADVRLGPILEAIINGKYYWVPFDRISAIELEAPSDLRDLVWCPANITFATGGEQVAFIPSRYPGSEVVTDDAVRLSRRTDWKDVGSDTFVGIGQRMFTTNVDDYAMLESRKITFIQPEPAADVSDANDAMPEEPPAA